MNLITRKQYFCMVVLLVQAIFFTSNMNLFALNSNFGNDTIELPISDVRLKSIAYRAIVFASNLLSQDKTDKRGLLLIDFAKNFIPRDKDLLLLRGRLKFKLPVQPIKSKRQVSKEQFIDYLREIIKDIPNESKTINRHLKVMFYGLIRLFKPDDNTAIIALVAYEDLGYNIDLEIVLSESLISKSKIIYDPKDSRYIISNIRKTVPVVAKEPWTDSLIKVKKGKIIRVTTTGAWSMGEGPFPSCDGDGYVNWVPPSMITKKNKKVYKVEKEFNPGQLVARIGRKVYAIGASGTFRADTTGILEFGPYEWNNYNNNTGRLLVTITVADR